MNQRVAQAEPADSAPGQDGLTIPEEIARRQERKAALQKARAEMEARAPARPAAEPPPPPAGASRREGRKPRLARVAGKQKYKLRPPPVEPVLGIIKRGPGFRQFLWRGLAPKWNWKGRWSAGPTSARDCPG